MVENGRAFQAWMAPHVEGMRTFCRSVDAVAERHGQLPDASSEAMKELAVEPDYRRLSTWRNPVTDSHMFGGMTLRAATDFVRSFAQLFDSEQPPVYGHAVIARAAFESATVSAWLNEPGIGVPERIRRGLCEQLYSAREVHDLRIVDDSAKRVDEWVAVAGAYGWTARRGSSRVNGDGRRPVSEGIVRAAGSDAGSRIGDLLYCRTAAISHVTWFGLQSALDIAGATVDAGRSLGTVAWGTDSSRVGAICVYMLKTMRAAASARVELMGWHDSEWGGAVDQEVSREDALARATLGRL